MTQYDVKEMQTKLKNNGYQKVRCNGSHQIWSDGKHTVSLPVVKLSPVIARRLVKEFDLR